MEEDIKILKEFLETAKIHTSIVPDINFEPIYKEQIQAIDNILNRLKQDERVIEEIAECINNLGWSDLDNNKDIIEHFRNKANNKFDVEKFIDNKINKRIQEGGNIFPID